MKQELIPLDVCLNNGRSHVEVLQIVSGAADVVCESASDVRLTSFGIHSITDKCVAMLLLDNQSQHLDMESALIAEAEFQTSSGARWAKFAELHETAPADSLPETLQYELVEDRGDLTASYKFENVRNLQDVLTLVARTNKHLHQRHIAGARDIWFSGIRNASIPRQISEMDLAGKIQYQKLRVMRRDGQSQSLSKITLSFDEKHLQEMEAAILFAFKE